MNSVRETSELGRDWVAILREQGRTMTWLSQETGKTYPQVRAYATGITKPPSEWLERVHQLLGIER